MVCSGRARRPCRRNASPLGRTPTTAAITGAVPSSAGSARALAASSSRPQCPGGDEQNYANRNDSFHKKSSSSVFQVTLLITKICIDVLSRVRKSNGVTRHDFAQLWFARRVAFVQQSRRRNLPRCWRRPRVWPARSVMRNGCGGISSAAIADDTATRFRTPKSGHGWFTT